MIYATYVNIVDNVPFQRTYRTRKMFKAAYSRMKNAVLDYAIDYRTAEIIRQQDLKTLH